MKSAPAVRLRMSAKVLLLRRRSPSREENQARHRHHRVPVVMKHSPSVMTAANLEELSPTMNWGIKARKNKATFGLRAFVSNPCRYTAQKPDDEKAAGIAAAVDRLNNIREPR